MEVLAVEVSQALLEVVAVLDTLAAEVVDTVAVAVVGQLLRHLKGVLGEEEDPC